MFHGNYVDGFWESLRMRLGLKGSLLDQGIVGDDTRRRSSEDTRTD